MGAFNVDGALKAGYSADDIVKHLGETKKFDVAGAQKAGYSATEILDHFKSRSQKAPEPPPPGTPGIPPAPIPAGLQSATPPPKVDNKLPEKNEPASATPPLPQNGKPGPQIQAEEQKVPVTQKPKPGPAFVTPYKVTAGSMPSKRSEEAGPTVWAENIINATRSGNPKKVIDAALANPAFGTGEEGRRNLKKLDDDLSAFLVGPFAFHKGAIEAGIETATDPASLATAGAFSGSGAIAKAVSNPYVTATWHTAQTALAAYFSKQAGTAAYEKGKDAVKQLQAGDYQTAAKTLGTGTVDGLFALLGAIGAIKGGLDIKTGIQQGIEIGKVKAALQDELYKREYERRAQERAANKPKQITSGEEPPAESPKKSKFDAARNAAGKALEAAPEEAPPEAPTEQTAPPAAAGPTAVALAEPPKPKEEVAAAAIQDAENDAAPPEERRGTQFLSPKEIDVDPARFQYKRGTGKGGVRDALTKVKKWNPDSAGVLTVWRDPANSKTYVINGHHRLDLAKRLDAPEVEVRYMDAATAQEARLRGAIQNIAENSGTPLDAAQLFRESNYTAQDLEDQGLDLNNKLAQEGFGISKLAEPLYDAVKHGEMSESRGAIIGNGLPNTLDQISIAREIESKEKSGRSVNDGTVKEMIRLANDGPQRTETQTDLFGTSESRRTLYTEMAEVSDYVRKQIATEKKLFGTVSTEGVAQQLSRSGNVIKAGENKAISEGASQAQAIYDKMSGKAGDVNEILRQAAEDLADGKSAKQVKEAAYGRIRESLSKVIPRGEGASAQGSAGGSEVVPSGSAAVAGGTGGGEPSAAGVRESASLDLFGEPRAAGEVASEPPDIKRKKSKKVAQFLQRRRDLYTSGNVNHNQYWQNYYKVLSYSEKPDGDWIVQVQTVNADGSPIVGERVRSHRTEPGKEERVVSSAAEPPLGPEAGVIRVPAATVEKVREFKEKLTDAGRAVVETIAPRAGVPEKGLTAIMKALGERNKASFQLQQTMGEIEDIFDQMPRDQQIEFIDRMKTGQAQATPELDQIVDLYKDLEQKKFNAIQRYNPSITWKDNHFRVFWKRVPGEPEEAVRGSSGSGRRPFSGTRGFFKQASLADMSEGLRWDVDMDRPELEKRIRQAKLQPNEYTIGNRPNPANPLFGISEFTPKSNNANNFILDQERQGTKIIRKGGEPWSYNPQVLFYRSTGDVINYVSAQRMWEYLKDTGLRKYVKGPKEHPAEPTPEGFEDLNDRLAEVFFPARSGEGLVQPGRWVVDRNVARLLNNYLSRDFLRDSFLAKSSIEKTVANTGNALLKLKNITTAWELSVSPFHLIAESLEAVSTQMGIGFTRAWNIGVRELNGGQFAKGILEAITAPVSPVTAARYGGDVIRAAIADMIPAGSPPPEGSLARNAGRAVLGRARQVTPEDIRKGGEFIRDNPDAIEHFNDLMMGGLRLDMSPDYKINLLRAFWNNLREMRAGQNIASNSVGAVWKLFPAFNEAFMKPLFEVYIPRLKIGFAMKDYAQQIEEHVDELIAGKVTRVQLARASVDRMENRFGEMNFDNLFWNRTMKTTLQIAIRSVTWRLGTLRAFGGAATGQVNNLFDPVRLMVEQAKSPSGINIDKNYIPKLHPNMGWLIGLTLTTAIIGEMIARLGTGKSPSQWATEEAKKSRNFLGDLTREYLHPRIDMRLDDRGKPNRVTPPTYLARDLEPLMKDPLKYIKGGQSSIIQNLPEVWNNEDYFGNFVYDPNDPTLKKVIAGAGHIIGLPFIASTYEREKQSGSSKAQIAAGFAGFPAASRSVDMSKAEELARSMNRTKYKMTPEELDDAQERRDLASRIRSGDKSVASSQEFNQLTGQQRSAIRRKVSRSYLQQQVSQLGIKDALAVYDAATPEERQDIKPTIMRKMHLIRKIHDKKERDRIEQKFNAIFPPATPPAAEDYIPPAARSAFNGDSQPPREQ